MTTSEFRNSKEYAECMSKIKGYSQGFEFTIPYFDMTKGQRNAMNIVTQDAVKQGLLKSTSLGLNLEGDIVEERFTKL